MIRLHDVSFGYSRSRKVLDGFSLEFPEGGVYGLLGGNGAGKSTLLHLMAGLLFPSGGSVSVDGVEAGRRDPRVTRDLFLVPEEFDLPPVTLRQYVAALRPFYPRFSDTLLAECLAGFGMEADARLSELSMGERKKVYVCVALAANTRYLLMDEPTNGLDILSKSQFRKVVVLGMSREKTVIISTHQVHDVERLLDHVTIIGRRGVLLHQPLVEGDSPVNLEELYLRAVECEGSAADGAAAPACPPLSLCPGGGEGARPAGRGAFSPRRLLAVARWDLSVHRRFYTRTLAMVTLCMVVPVLFRYFGHIDVGAGDDGVPGFILPADYIGGVGVILVIIGWVASVVLMGYMFHGLGMRQGRVSELTLPASNGERFVWRAALVVVGGQLAVLAAVLAADAAHVLLAWALRDATSFHSLTRAVYRFYPFPGLKFSAACHGLFALSWHIGVLAFCSTFALGNAWRYRYNVVLTAAAHVGFWLAFTIVSGLCLSLALGRHAGAVLRVAMEVDERVWGLVCCAASLAVLAGVWALTWRLYRRAQITTRRNP